MTTYSIQAGIGSDLLYERYPTDTSYKACKQSCMRDYAAIKDGARLPNARLEGQRPTRYPESNKFAPTWARVLCGDRVIEQWGDCPASLDILWTANHT